MRTTIAQVLARTVDALQRSKERGNKEWVSRHLDTLRQIERDLLPSGSGIDRGTKIDLVASSANKIVLRASFHHMDEWGYYDGWTEHVITVRPAFCGLDITISGRDRNGIKDYLHEVFCHYLDTEGVPDVTQRQGYPGSRGARP